MHAVHNRADLTPEVQNRSPPNLYQIVHGSSPLLTRPKTSNLTKFVPGVSWFNTLVCCPSAFRYSNPFRKCSATMKIGPQKRQFCDFNWLPWKRPLIDRQTTSKFIKPLHSFTNPENLLKIRTVVPGNS